MSGLFCTLMPKIVAVDKSGRSRFGHRATLRLEKKNGSSSMMDIGRTLSCSIADSDAVQSKILQKPLGIKNKTRGLPCISTLRNPKYRSSGALQRLHQICHCDLQCIGPFFKLTHHVDSDSNYINHHWARVYKGGSVVPFR